MSDHQPDPWATVRVEWTAQHFRVYYAADVDAAKAEDAKTIADLRAQLAAVQEKAEAMRTAILWALGLNGEFPPEPEPLAGKYRRRYHWRKELAERAGIDLREPLTLKET